MRIASLSAALFAAFLAASSLADTSAGFSVDGRGLPNVEGILLDNSKAHYGFVNFVAFGPNWAYTAQDYAAKEQKKASVDDPKYGRGLLFTGKIWAGSTGLAIREEFYDLGKAKGEEGKVHVRWQISSLDSKPMSLERAYVRFPLSRAEFALGKANAATLPEAYGAEWIDLGAKDRVRIVSKDGAKALNLAVEKGNAALQDARKDKVDRFELRIDFPEAKAATSSTIEFDVSGAFADAAGKKPGRVRLDIPPPPAKMVANDDWCVFPFSNEIETGSILDFSKIGTLDAPAGKYGFVKATKEGHFAFEKNPKPVRFVGGNLCFDANFLSKDEAKAAVNDFVRRGWNTIRFHHIDVTITKDEWNKVWNRPDMPELSPTRLDQLDYLMAECKKAGIYVTFDLYAMGALGSCVGPDGKPIILNCNTVKAWVPVWKPAEDEWFKRAMEMFNHVNPYTGVAWKDEPAILFVTLMNEDSINSVWWGAADKYVADYTAWAEKKGYPKYEKKGIGDKAAFAEFLFEVKANANRRMGRRLKEAGVKALISGGNWWDTMAQTYERAELDVVDNHGYGDHPQPSYQKLPFHVNNANDMCGNGAYNEPVMKAPSRILGKPFTVTEYNYCVPNKYRADGGLMMGAYASLQDWDALYRFAWSHSRGRMFKPSPINGFDIVVDPIGQLTEREIVLLFGRRDVKPAENTIGYGVTKGEAMEKGLGDMWAKGIFPLDFTDLAYVSRIGSFVADGGAAPALACTATYTAANRKALPKFAGRAVSDTKEIAIDLKKSAIAVKTPKTAGVCACKLGDLAAGPLAVSGATTFCNVAASAMDGATLENSKRVLIFHITDVRNTGMEFANANGNDTKKWGELPYLAKTGSAKIALKNANPGLTVYALASNGTHLRKVPATYAEGAYHFTAKVAAGTGAEAPTMMYELSR